jgi:hypothetical protein
MAVWNRESMLWLRRTLYKTADTYYAMNGMSRLVSSRYVQCFSPVYRPEVVRRYPVTEENKLCPVEAANQARTHIIATASQSWSYLPFSPPYLYRILTLFNHARAAMSSISLSIFASNEP